MSQKPPKSTPASARNHSAGNDSPSPNAHDRDLAARARRGDREALGDLLDRHHTRLYNVALRMTGHIEDAAELTQEAMLKIIEHIGQFRGGSKVTTWMIRIVMNGCLSHLRRRATRSGLSIDQGAGDDAVEGEGAALRDSLQDHREPKPDWGVQRDEGARQVREALTRVDPDHRAVLILRDIQEMDYKKISDVLGVPTGTVKSRLFRARVALRQQLARLEEPEFGQHQASPTRPAG